MKHIKEYFHWLFVVAPLISIVFAFFWGTDEKVIEFIFIPSALILNFLIIWLKSYLDKNEKQGGIRSFLTDELLPNKIGKSLEFNAKVVIVEDEVYNGTFIRTLERQFKSKPESKERDLILVPFSCGALSKDNQKNKLINKLEGATAVVIIRTKELEEKTWVYDVIDSWAYKRSDVPILFTRLAEGEYKSPIPNGYFSIPPDDSKLLPWRLLQRANERGLAWRHVASFNRLIATNLFTLLVMSICIGHFLISNHKKEDAYWFQNHEQLIQNQQKASYDLLGDAYNGSANDNVISGVYDGIARQTKEQFEESITKSNDDKLIVAYYIRDEDRIRPQGTTDEHSNRTPWNLDETTVIGCAYSKPFHFVEWSRESKPGTSQESSEPNVLDFNGNKLTNHGCLFFTRPSQKITSIVCAAYRSPNDQGKGVVGICISTQSENNILKYSYHEFLRKKTIEFYEFVSRNKTKPLIQFDLLWLQIGNKIDLPALDKELSTLLPELKKRAKEPAHYQAIWAISLAMSAVKEKNGAKVLEYLRKGREWTNQIALELNLKTATDAMRAALSPPTIEKESAQTSKN